MNPIRKRRSIIIRNPHSKVALGVPGYWYAICPKCDQEISKGRESRWSYSMRSRTRKEAKDALHRHLLIECK